MRALVLHGPFDLRVDDVPEPPPPERDEVVVAPVVGGICGTDLQLFRGGRPLGAPQILCHEFAARVVAVGPDVADLEPGDRAVVVPIEACGRCSLCIAGIGEMCPGHRSLGLRHPWGGFADLATARRSQVVRLPDSVSWEQAALVEPLAVATTGVARAGVRPGDDVLVMGGGPIGALAALASRATGAGRIVVVEPLAGRRSHLRKLGFEVIDSTRDDPVAYCMDHSRGLGFDCAIDCAGVAEAFATAVRSVKPTGRISVTAVHGAPVEIDLRDLLRRNLTLRAGFAYPLASFPKRLAQIVAGSLPVEQIVTTRLPMAEGLTAFERLGDPAGADLKILVRIDD